VEARFDVVPPLPAPSGILGAAGIVDRPPVDGGLVSVSSVSELRELLGPGTEASMPEVAHALANGASEAVISPVDGGAPASVRLDNANGAPAVILRCRSNGTWGNRLRADLRGIANAAGNFVRVSLRILADGEVLESFNDLQIAPGQPDDLFETINRRSRLVVALDPGFSDATPAENTFAFGDDDTPVKIPESNSTRTLLQLFPGEGASRTGLSVRTEVEGRLVNVKVFQGGLQEEFNNLELNPDSDLYMPYVLLTQSRFIRVRPISSLPEGEGLPRSTDAPIPFDNGTSPTVAQYAEAIERLSEDTRIDLVLASVEPGRTNAFVRQVHQALVAHAVVMSDKGAPRIAFGSVTHDEMKKPGEIKDHAATVRNRRFVLVSPPRAEGAVAGLVGRMNPQDSPTFKNVPLFGIPAARYRESELNKLLGPTTNLLVVQDRPGHGVVVLKGIDTTGDQISVTRVADQAIRETKAISENFIGQLNTDDARIALRQQLVSTFIRMERDGAIVPSTDGTDPSYLVNVYSTQTDFAQGIVRIDIAVRPVRSIDYIYATIRVKN